MMIRLLTVFVAALLASGAALAQNAMRQNGPATNYDIYGFIGDHAGESASKMFNDNGRGFNPFHIYDGGNNAGVCTEEALTTTGYHPFCLGHDSSGNGILSFNSFNGAATRNVFLSVNGTQYQMPFVGAGSGNVAGPNTSAVNQLSAFNATNGTALSTFGSPFYLNANGLAAGYGLPPVTPEHTLQVLNTYIGGGAGGSAAGIYGIVDYKYVPGGTNFDNPSGVYGQTILSAAQTYGGVPAGVKGNGYTAPVLTATIGSPGTAYTNGDIVTIVGGVCGSGNDLNTPPQFTLTASGGVVTAAKFISTGTGGCSTYPTNPVSVTGGTGTGLTLNLSNGAINSTFLTGAYGRCRNVSLGTITYCVSVFADGGYNTGGGSVTNQVNFFAQPPYDTHYGSAYMMLMAAATCSPNCWPNGTLLAAGDPIVLATQTAGQGILLNSAGFLTLQTPTGGFNILIKPGGTSVTQITANTGTIPLSGSSATAGLYPYMLSTGAAYIDALALGAAATTLDLRTYAGSGVYSDGIHIIGTGALFFNATPTVGTGTAKHLVCIDPATHEIYEGTGATCS